MTLRTERLELRPIEPADGDELHAFFLDPDVRRYLLDGMQMGRDWIDQTIADSAASFERHGLGLWAAREHGAEPIVGVVGYREFHDPPVLEMLWALLPTHWKRGLATEMAQAAVDAGFAAGLDVIRAGTDLPNEASVRVMERLGMRFDHRGPGDVWDQLLYVLDKPA